MIMQQQQQPMHGRQQQMHVPQGTMFQPRPQPSHVFRPQQMPGQSQLVPQQQQQQQQQQPPQQLPQQQQQPNATSDAAEQYWALQERMRDAYLPSLREIQRMHKGTVRGGQTVSYCCCCKGLLSACPVLALLALSCCQIGWKNVKTCRLPWQILHGHILSPICSILAWVSY